MMSGKAQLNDAVQAIKLGAFQFLEKPLTPEAVLVTIRSALELTRAQAENRALRSQLQPPPEMVGHQRADREGARDDRPGGADGCAGAHPRRIGHRQGARRPRDSPLEPPRQPALRHRQLRCDSARPRRVGDVRPREGRLHGGDGPAARALRAGARRHPVPGRGGRPQPGGPGQAAPRARERRGRRGSAPSGPSAWMSA